MSSRMDMPPDFDFIFERDEPSIARDPFREFLEDAHCSYKGMSAAVSYQHILNLREETAVNDQRFRKRFDRGTAPPASSQTLAKNSRTREDVTTFPAAGLRVVAVIDEETGAVIETRTEKIA